MPPDTHILNKASELSDLLFGSFWPSYLKFSFWEPENQYIYR